MNKYWSGLVAAGVMAVGASVAGQSQNPANTPPRDAASPAGVQRTPDAPSAQTKTPGNIVTISGCIQNAPAMAANAGAGAVAGGGAAGADRAGNTGNAGSAAAGNANPAGNAGAGAAASRPTTGGSSFVLANASMAGAGSTATRGVVGTSGSASTYRLDGESSTLSAHVNHQVRVTGMLQDSAASATGAANANANATAAGPTLRVETVTMVADTCTGVAGAPGSGTPNQGAQPQGNRPAGVGGGNTTPGSNPGNTTRPQP